MARQPWKRGTGKTYRKAGYKRTNTGKSIKSRASKNQIRNAGIMRLRRNDFGFPDSMITKFKYGDQQTLTSAAGVVANTVYRLNSINDPDFSFGGHQPMWYDQFLGASAASAPYKNYRVLNSTIKVTFSYLTAPATVAVNQGPALVGIVPSTSSTLLASSTAQLLETDAASTKFLGDKAASNNIRVLYASYNPQRDLGLDIGDDTISALYNANPTQAFYAHVLKIDSVGTSTVIAYVELEYTVELFQRNEVGQS